MGDSDLFSLFIHHGGHFGMHEGRDVYMKGFFVVKPPRVRKMAGRPKKKRIRSACEPNPRNPSKMSQNGMPMTCSNCKGPNHNSRTCSKPKVVQPPAPKRKRGRPAKEKNATEDETSRSGDARGGAVRGRAASLHGRGIYVSRGRCGRRSVARGEATGRGGARGGSVAAQIAIERNMAKG